MGLGGLLLEGPLCVGSLITCTYPRVAPAAEFEVSIERGEEDSPADMALELHFASGSLNKASSEGHQGVGRRSGSRPDLHSLKDFFLCQLLHPKPQQFV